MSEIWMITRTGGIDPFHPTPGAIQLRDLASGLAGRHRWAGQSPAQPTVAQHCVEVSRAAESLEWTWDLQAWCLMHDAAEAYLGDVAAPLRAGLGWIHGARFTNFAQVEMAILHAVSQRFGLSWPMPRAMGTLDLRHRATEARDLFDTPRSEALLATIDAEPFTERLGRRWLPLEAEEMFLDRFEELFGAIQSE